MGIGSKTCHDHKYGEINFGSCGVKLRFVLRNQMLSSACIVRWRKITNQGMTLLLEGTQPSERHQKATAGQSKLFLISIA